MTYASDINGRNEYLYAKAFGPDAQAKLNKRSQQTEAAFGVAVDRSLGIAIHRFPSDPELPGLNRLAGITTMGRGRRMIRGDQPGFSSQPANGRGTLTAPG